jgi:hypothetical protein
MLGRSRLQEYFQRILREDMLTLFNHTASLRSLECSIVLNGAQTMSDEAKYRAACILEILTGQQVTGSECDVMQEDPSHRTATEAQKREMERARGALIQQSIMAAAGKQKKNIPKPDTSKVSQEIKKLGSGIKLKSSLHNVRMYYFLEKCREFYLPDIVGGAEEVEREGWKPLDHGHDNTLEKRGLILQYQKQGGSKRDCYPERYPLRRNENPREAISCYTLRSSDLLKFPDIEVHFEALGSVLGGMRAENTSQALQLVLRPTVRIDTPLDKESLRKVPQIDNLRVMNYLLSQYFNAYMTRPHVG